MSETRRLPAVAEAGAVAGILRADPAWLAAHPELCQALRAASGMNERVQAAVLALLRGGDAAECVSSEMPHLLGIDAAAVCAEHPDGGWHVLPAGTVARLLDGRDVVFRAAPADAFMLHGEAARLARHDALVRLPGHGPPALLALASRDACALDPAQGAGALAFLGRAVAVALGR